MFKKFNGKDDVKGTTPVKSSVQRAIKSKLVETYPKLESVINDLFPKKSQLLQVKCEDRITLYCMNGEVLLFEHYNGPIIPSLRLVHKCPDAFPQVCVDRGAIKFVLSGANIMIPGLTSATGDLPDDIPKDVFVVVMAEGKEAATAIGYTKMSAQEMKKVGKGIGIENVHYLGDNLVCLL
ncbi:RNA-binding protein Tma20 [Schizosaccharomyces japonicus yFS275]|uniref:Translation machinery-associated protein 20 n=1 Tax=Schizosaccharomyces japonicus (strain yFS275 / FY16936) TaxID=402676 RepID=B6JWY7_SCHJY|nr:RNA-binding protein Tma20 [Schizosaccharomyces japonicus yFS275]EEB05888.2 RNA-binding protein Tma20 [Schizosaccharomyces japonicus yFS275]